jgi:hypothetical protein
LSIAFLGLQTFIKIGTKKLKTYSTNFLAEAFEVDRASATRALRDIAPDQESTKDRPTYKIATFARALEAHHLKNASNNDGGSGGDSASETSSLTAARVRIALANAEAKERANSIAAGGYCDIEAAVYTFGQTMAVMREIILTLPGKVADGLTALCSEDRTKIYETIYREVVEVLTALSSPESYVAVGVASATETEATNG